MTDKPIYIIIRTTDKPISKWLQNCLPDMVDGELEIKVIE